jgi:guanine deaminase
MTQEAFISILVAEDNDVSREMMSAVLRTQGYHVYGAVDGESAITVLQDRPVDLALVDINMAPKSGFELIKYMIVKSLDIPVVVITGDDSSNILMDATALGVVQVIQKPVDPEKLIQVCHRILKRRGFDPQPLAVSTKETKFSPKDLMQKAIALADRNAKSKRGGPFGAIVADEEGKILGEGTNGITSRVDPTAHAEVMAIRQAADRLGRSDLSDCTLYCSSQPTMIGQALIASVGINTVYYGLASEEVRSIRKSEQAKPLYKQLAHAEAQAMFKSWQEQKEKVAD